MHKQMRRQTCLLQHAATSRTTSVCQICAAETLTDDLARWLSSIEPRLGLTGGLAQDPQAEIADQA